MTKDIQKLKYDIGFTPKNLALIQEAFTHPSYATEHNLKYDNQRLEHLGDAVLQLLLTDYLFKKYPKEQEGVLTNMRSALVKRDALAILARHLNLGDYLRLGRGESAAKGNERESNLADLFEAFVGAIYLGDGYEKVKEFLIPIIELLFPNPKELLLTLNPKGRLQEYTVANFNDKPVYKQISLSGPEHNPCFVVSVSINTKVICEGIGPKRKIAESDAAQKAMKSLLELPLETQLKLYGK